MIEIRNITTNNSISVKTSYSGSRDAPLHITMRPNDILVLADDQLKLYDGGPRQNLAELISKKMITMAQANGVHIYQDKGNLTDYQNWCAQGGSGAPLMVNCVPTVVPPVLQNQIPSCCDTCLPIQDWNPGSDGLHWEDAVSGLQQAINAFNNLLDTYNAHALDVAFHTVAGVASAAVYATDLPTLITNIQVLVTNYNTHIAAGALHPTADTTNAVTVVVPATLEDCVILIRNIKANYDQHRLQYYVTSLLTPVQVLTY